MARLPASEDGEMRSVLVIKNGIDYNGWPVAVDEGLKLMQARASTPNNTTRMWVESERKEVV